MSFVRISVDSVHFIMKCSLFVKQIEHVTPPFFLHLITELNTQYLKQFCVFPDSWNCQDSAVHIQNTYYMTLQMQTPTRTLQII